MRDGVADSYRKFEKGSEISRKYPAIKYWVLQKYCLCA